MHKHLCNTIVMVSDGDARSSRNVYHECLLSKTTVECYGKYFKYAGGITMCNGASNSILSVDVSSEKLEHPLDP